MTEENLKKQREATRRYRERHPGRDMEKYYARHEANKAYCRERYKNDPEYKARMKAYSKAWRIKNPDKTYLNNRRKHLLKTFGLSLKAYEKLVKKQDSKCAICKRFDSKLQVDHDHATGKIRGLLCRRCNSTIGRFYDDAILLEAAANYLRYSKPFNAIAFAGGCA